MCILKKDDIVIWDVKSNFYKDSFIRSTRVYRIKEDCFGLYVSEPFMDNLYCLDGFIEINSYVKMEYNLEVGECVINPITNEKYIIDRFDAHYLLGITIIHTSNEYNIASMVSIKDLISIKDYRNNIINSILNYG